MINHITIYLLHLIVSIIHLISIALFFIIPFLLLFSSKNSYLIFYLIHTIILLNRVALYPLPIVIFRAFLFYMFLRAWIWRWAVLLVLRRNFLRFLVYFLTLLFMKIEVIFFVCWGNILIKISVLIFDRYFDFGRTQYGKLIGFFEKIDFSFLESDLYD
jgi:hypothetical protein